MNTLQCYKLYLACRLHFTTKYDIFEYGGRVPNATNESMNKRPGRAAMLNKLVRQFNKPVDLVQYFVAQCAYSDINAIYDPMRAEENHIRWHKNKVSMTRVILDDLYEQDVQKIIMGDPPEIFKMIIKGQVNIETAVAVNNMLNFVKEDYLVMNNLGVKIVKLRRFVKFDINRVSQELELDYETA